MGRKIEKETFFFGKKYPTTSFHFCTDRWKEGPKNKRKREKKLLTSLYIDLD